MNTETKIRQINAANALKAALHPHRDYMPFFEEHFPKLSDNDKYYIRQFMRGAWNSSRIQYMVEDLTVKILESQKPNKKGDIKAAKKHLKSTTEEIKYTQTKHDNTSGEFLTGFDAAEYLGIKCKELAELCREGKIKKHSESGVWAYKRKELDIFMQKNKDSTCLPIVNIDTINKTAITPDQVLALWDIYISSPGVYKAQELIYGGCIQYWLHPSWDNRGMNSIGLEIRINDCSPIITELFEGEMNVKKELSDKMLKQWREKDYGDGRLSYMDITEKLKTSENREPRNIRKKNKSKKA